MTGNKALRKGTMTIEGPGGPHRKLMTAFEEKSITCIDNVVCRVVAVANKEIMGHACTEFSWEEVKV